MPARKPKEPEIDPTTRVVQEVMAGRHDARLSEIIEACTLQIMGDRARVSWWITVRGEKILEEDFTVDESIAIEDDLGIAWANVGPGAAARHHKAILVVLLMSRFQVSESEAKAEAGKLTRRQCAEAMGTYTADPSPAALS